MRQVDAEVDRFLVLLGNVIRQRGFTQLEVQKELGWGRSYISQLVTKQKGLRMDQLLLILSVIGVKPAEYFRELYAMPGAPIGVPAPAPGPRWGEEELRHFRQMRAQVRGLVRLMVEKRLIEGEELQAAVEAAGKEG